MYLTLNGSPIYYKSKGSKLGKRNFTHKSSFVNLTDKPFLSEKIHFCHNKISKINTADTSSGLINDSLTYFKALSDTFPDLLYCFKGLLNGSYIKKIEPLISDFYFDAMITKVSFNTTEVVFFNNFIFIPQCFASQGFFFDGIVFLLHNRLVNTLLLCASVHLIQLLSTLLSYDKKWSVLTYLCNRIIIFYDIVTTKYSIINMSWFKNMHSYILSLSSWCINYLEHIRYNKLHYLILHKIYLNIKHLMFRFSMNSSLSKVNLVFYKYLYKYQLNIISFAGYDINVLFASLSPLYVFFGWLLDYLSYMWIVQGNGLNFRHVSKLSFWIKRFSYAILFMLWLNLGVISTNGIYFLLLSQITSIHVFNIAILIIGSVIASISSSTWFAYGKPSVLKSFNIFRFIVDRVLLPVITPGRFNIINSLSESFHSVFTPYYFNGYTSFRRSVLEWLSFLGMVLSSFGTWAFYTLYVFYSISIISNFIIWTASSFVFGFFLIYLEDTRPVYSIYYYGFVYLFFWTSLCFSTNTILLGYINIANAAYALIYFIPINFLIAFIYSLPLYRYNSQTTILSRFVDLLLFILLIGITLLSVGTLWILIAPS